MSRDPPYYYKQPSIVINTSGYSRIHSKPSSSGARQASLVIGKLPFHVYLVKCKRSESLLLL